MSEPVTLNWELSTPAPIERTWALLSDTDQFNRVAGLGFRFEDSPQPDGTVRRVGRAQFLGTEMSWDEIPFQYRVPEWFRCVRRFHGTPATEVVSTLRLRRKGTGTEIRYSIAVTPRGAWAVPLVWGELHLRTKPKINQAFDVFMTQLSGSVSPPPADTPALEPDAERRLGLAMADLRPTEVAPHLAGFLRSAPLREQSRMAPIKLARAWGLPERVVIDGMLDAVRRGVLALSWDLICPACQGASTRLEKLGDPGRRVHCTSCNVYYDGTFPDSVEVSFYPSPALRTLDVAVECAGSPARQPHVVASERLAPGELAELTLTLEPGAYRIRSWPPLFTASLEVNAALTPTALDIQANAQALEPARLRAHPGEITVRLRNDGARTLDIVVENRERPDDVLTAGRLLELPGVKDLLPEKVVDPAFAVESMRATAVLVPVDDRNPDPKQETAELFRSFKPRRLVQGERGTMGIWVEMERAWGAASATTKLLGRGCAVSTGPILEVQLDEDELVPMGSAVDQVLKRMPLVEPGALLGSTRELMDAEVQRVVREQGLKPGPERRVVDAEELVLLRV